MSCAHKDVFQKPNTGIHSYRVPIPFTKKDVAILDTLITLLLAAIIAFVVNRSQFLLTFALLSILLVLVSIPIHYFLCVNTTLTKLVFGMV